MMRIYISEEGVDMMTPNELAYAHEEIERTMRRVEAEYAELEKRLEQVKRRLGEATDAAA